MSDSTQLSVLNSALLEDDEQQWVVMELAVMEHIYESVYYREPCRDSSMTGPMWVHEILNGHSDRCYDELRMERHVFENLCARMKYKGWLEDSRYLRIDEQIAIFLQSIQGKGGHRKLAERFQRSLETVSRVFRNVLNAFLKLGKENIKPPSFDETPPEIRQNPKYYPFFKDCIGAIDGTHITAAVPSSKKTTHINRKGYTLQNVMCVCSFDMKFTFVLSGWEGSANDCRIFADARQRDCLRFPHSPAGKYYVLDSGYPNINGYLVPFKGERYHLQDYNGGGRQPRTAKELFNHRHSSLRNVIERCFGVLKKRFPILTAMPTYPIQLQAYIVIACCALHNFIKDEQRLDKWFASYSSFDAIVDDDGSGRTSTSRNNPSNEAPFYPNQAMDNLRKDIANQLARRHRFQQIP